MPSSDGRSSRRNVSLTSKLQDLGEGKAPTNSAVKQIVLGHDRADRCRSGIGAQKPP